MQPENVKLTINAGMEFRTLFNDNAGLPSLEFALEFKCVAQNCRSSRVSCQILMPLLVPGSLTGDV